MVQQWNSVGVTVERCLWNSVMEQWNRESGTVWWNNEIVTVEQCGRTVAHGTMEQ